MRQEWTLLDFFRATFTLPLVLIFIFVGMVNSLVDNLLTMFSDKYLPLFFNICMRNTVLFLMGTKVYRESLGDN